MMYQQIAYILLGLGFVLLLGLTTLLFPSHPKTEPQPAATIQVVDPPAPALPSNDPTILQ